VLLHLEDIKKSTLAALDELELLRIYLRSLNPCICSIGLVLPIDNDRALAALERIGIEVLPVPISDETGRVPKQTADKLTTLLVQLLATALSYNLDCVVTDNENLLAYAPEFGEVGVLLTSPDFLLRYAETFARGNDLPWSFAHKVWFEPWMSFYQLSEQWTFTAGMNCLALCQSPLGADGGRTGASPKHQKLVPPCKGRSMRYGDFSPVTGSFSVAGGRTPTWLRI
jgi:hypothetical protein